MPGDQQGALLDWVSQGGAFLPIHCASACYGNSPAFVELVGAKFKSHASGVFAPKTVANFLRYADEGFYDNTIFHRVIRGFMVQGGGFTKDLERKSTHKAVAYEGDNGLANNRGTLAMARTQDPNSATSQFFINQVDNVFLNHGASGGAGYTVFGHVISGMDVVDAIAAVTTSNVGPYQNVPTTPVTIKSVSRVN